MTLKKHYWKDGTEGCITCMYIDEYAINVAGKGKVPHGYDGTASCCVHDYDKEETMDNRLWISPLWKACPKYKRCTERQADYLDIYDEETKSIIPNPNDISKINRD